MIEEDYQAWNAYPDYRWIFNKLEVALRFGYDAGPTGVPITEAKNYIIRPIYNLYGMGIGAQKRWLDPEIHNNEILQCMHIPPGYFWCEYFEGEHFSVDFVREKDIWKPFSKMAGYHRTVDNLVQFDHWVVQKPEFELPQWMHEISGFNYLNIESKNDKIFEIHLRSGNDHIWSLNPGSVVYPVWEGEDDSELKDLKWEPNLHEDHTIYTAGGQIKNIRLGYRILEK